MDSYHCNDCSKEFSEKEFYFQHLRDKHAQSVCPACGKLCADELGVKQHKRMVHNIVRPFLRKKNRENRRKSVLKDQSNAKEMSSINRISSNDQ